MNSKYHIAITVDALENRLDKSGLDIVLRANTGQDSLLNLLKSEYHFDANAGERAEIYFSHQQELLMRAVKDGDRIKALEALGRACHSVQDFYAHSNYVLLWTKKHGMKQPEAISFMATRDPELINSPELKFARVYYPWEIITLFPLFQPLMKQILPADSHARMNLDSPESGELFPLALLAAKKQTRVLFDEICNRIDEELGQEARSNFTRFSYES